MIKLLVNRDEYNAKARARWRERYYNEPEFRARTLLRTARNNRVARERNPELKVKRNEYCRQYAIKHPDKMRKIWRDKQKEYWAKQRYKTERGLYFLMQACKQIGGGTTNE